MDARDRARAGQSPRIPSPPDGGQPPTITSRQPAGGPMPLASLVESVRWHIGNRADAPALIWRDDQVTYGELGAMVTDAEDALHRLRVSGDLPVCILGGKSPRTI